MKIEQVKITDVKPNPKNPRIIKDGKFRKLVQSIQEFPDMLNKRPLIVFTDVDGKYVVLGGNMRLKALKELKYESVPVIVADEWTEEQKHEFLIKDNVGFGEWDWDSLANEWDAEKLEDWGLDILGLDTDDEMYTTMVESPIYEPKGLKPNISELINTKKADELISEIDKSSLSDDEKKFLKFAAYRHVVFDYRKIAEYYAHADKDTQSLIENSALVIIDYNKAIEKGFVELHKTLSHLRDE
ncbi:MAG: transcriptional regulator [Caulobacteraceae bacterium]|nr:transcriptional regulator [Caulobacteraceae bacterium]